MSRFALPVLVVLSAVAFPVVLAAASPPTSFVAPGLYPETYVLPGGTTTTAVIGSGTANLTGYWDATIGGGTHWWADGANLYVGPTARVNNNLANEFGKPFIYASFFQFTGQPNNTGSANEVLEVDVGFDANMGPEGIFGDPVGEFAGSDDQGGGWTTLRIHNARYITHASQNLPTSWKNTPDLGIWFPDAEPYRVHKSHHGLLIFGDIMKTGQAATSSEWFVRTNDQTYDGGLYWKNDWRLDVEQGVTLSSNTFFEQAIIGPHVGFGTRPNIENTTLTKTGEGALVIARGGIQGYSPNSTIDIQAGRVEFNSNQTQNNPNYYLGNSSGQNLTLQVSQGAEVAFHAYTYPIDINWWSGGTYGPDSLHQIENLDSAGRVRLGGLWSPSSDAWDQAYYDVFESAMASPTGYGPALEAETAMAWQARLEVSGDLTLHATSVFEIILAEANASDDYRVQVGGNLVQAGDLVIIEDDALAAAVTDAGGMVFDLFDAETFSGSFNLVLPAAWSGGYDQTTGELTIATIPEPATMCLLALGGLGLIRRRGRR